jgi:hypothetical protein
MEDSMQSSEITAKLAAAKALARYTANRVDYIAKRPKAVPERKKHG